MTPKMCVLERIRPTRRRGGDLACQEPKPLSIIPDTQAIKTDPSSTYIRMPSFDQVTTDPVLYAHADRIFHRETNPGNAAPSGAESGSQRYLGQSAADSSGDGRAGLGL